jgi:hypothetical protein
VGQRTTPGETSWPWPGNSRVHRREDSCPPTGRIPWPPTEVLGDRGFAGGRGCTKRGDHRAYYSFSKTPVLTGTDAISGSWHTESSLKKGRAATERCRLIEWPQLGLPIECARFILGQLDRAAHRTGAAPDSRRDGSGSARLRRATGLGYGGRRSCADVDGLLAQALV